MRKIQLIIVIVLTSLQFTVGAQEKKIKFSSGTLKICSSKSFKIQGYDGNEVIIKSLHEKRKNSFSYLTTSKSNRIARAYTSQSARARRKPLKLKGKLSRTDSVSPRRLVFAFEDASRKEGLKKLGKKQENIDLGIYFTIEQKDGELIFKDETIGQFVMYGNESYEIMIPNSIKLNWDTNGCRAKDGQKVYTTTFFSSSHASSLSDFNGEVEISTSLNNMKLKDVTGPVSINSIGGNVTIEFDKKKPMRLYSIYSNNGFIDITLPLGSDVLVDAEGNAIYSDIDFKVLEEKDNEDVQKMKLRLKSGKSKMKLDAGLGNIYLRKK